MAVIVPDHSSQAEMPNVNAIHYRRYRPFKILISSITLIKIILHNYYVAIIITVTLISFKYYTNLANRVF